MYISIIFFKIAIKIEVKLIFFMSKCSKHQ